MKQTGMGAMAVPKGYTKEQARRLDRIYQEIDDVCGPFSLLIETATKESEGRMWAEMAKAPTEGIAASIQNSFRMELDRQIQAINASHGEKIFRIDIRDDDFAFLKQCWDAMEGYRGGKANVRDVAAVDEAIEKAEKGEQNGE